LIDGISVVSYEDLQRIDAEGKAVILIATTNSINIYQILNVLEQSKNKNIGLIKSRLLSKKCVVNLADDEVNGEIIWARKNGKEEMFIPRLELNLIDSCNLNCVACTHFSSIYHGKECVYPLEKYVNDLEKLRKVGKILRLRMLGGEPLLVENLSEYVKVTRKIFPEGNLVLVTNGLLIPKMNPVLWKILYENEIFVTVSLYQPTDKMKDEIENILNSYQLMWHYDGELISEFGKNLTIQKIHDGNASSANCISAGCTFMRNGKLYKCPIEGLLSDLLNHYGVKNPIEKCGVDLTNDSEEIYNQIKRMVLNPVETCEMCAEKMEMIPWHVKVNPELKDWLCEETE